MSFGIPRYSLLSHQGVSLYFFLRFRCKHLFCIKEVFIPSFLTFRGLHYSIVFGSLNTVYEQEVIQLALASAKNVHFEESYFDLLRLGRVEHIMLLGNH